MSVKYPANFALAQNLKHWEKFAHAQTARCEPYPERHSNLTHYTRSGYKEKQVVIQREWIEMVRYSDLQEENSKIRASSLGNIQVVAVTDLHWREHCTTLKTMLCQLHEANRHLHTLMHDHTFGRVIPDTPPEPTADALQAERVLTQLNSTVGSMDTQLYTAHLDIGQLVVQEKTLKSNATMILSLHNVTRAQLEHAHQTMVEQAGLISSMKTQIQKDQALVDAAITLRADNQALVDAANTLRADNQALVNAVNMLRADKQALTDDLLGLQEANESLVHRADMFDGIAAFMHNKRLRDT